LWLLQRQDFEIKRGKHTAVRSKGGERFIRFCSLGDGYRESDIREKIAAMQKSRRSKVQHKRMTVSTFFSIFRTLSQGGKALDMSAGLRNITSKIWQRLLFFF